MRKALLVCFRHHRILNAFVGECEDSINIMIADHDGPWRGAQGGAVRCGAVRWNRKEIFSKPGKTNNRKTISKKMISRLCFTINSQSHAYCLYLAYQVPVCVYGHTYVKVFTAVKHLFILVQ